MITFDAPRARFNFRVGGVCIHQEQVLLLRIGDADFWILPGGRCELMEPSAEALAREMHEELHLHVRVGPLLWLVESFFRIAGRDWHELGFYYRIFLPEGAEQLDAEREYHSMEDNGLPLLFRWFPITELADLPLYPAFLKDSLQSIPDHTEHVVEHDVNPEDVLETSGRLEPRA